ISNTLYSLYPYSTSSTFTMPPLSLLYFFFFNHPPPTELYTLSLHDALPISSGSRAKTIPLIRQRDHSSRAGRRARILLPRRCGGDRKSTRLNSSHVAISYAVFCLKKKNERNPKLLRNRKDLIQ